MARAGRLEQAAEAYRSALVCAMNDTDRRFIESRLADLESDTPPAGSS